MVRRHVNNPSVPDAFVFPGGSVKAPDVALERDPVYCVSAGEDEDVTALGSGFRVAAIHACFEEAGVLLARRGQALLAIHADEVQRFAAHRAALADDARQLVTIIRQEKLTLATDALLHWAHWITPQALPTRFNVHVFFTVMPPGQVSVHDRFPTVDGIWTTPEQALARFADGTFPLRFATIHQLKALCGLKDLANADQYLRSQAVRTVMPSVVERDGRKVVVLPGEA